jgi:hypothetical protein
MKRLAYLFVLALCLPGASLYAATIFTENFNELTPQLSVFTAGQFQTINGTNVDIVGGGLFGNLVVPPESGNAIDLGGSGGNSFGQLQSNAITLNPGTYTLNFDLVGSQRGVTTTTGVNLAPASGPSLYNHDFTLTSNDDTTGIVSGATFTVSGSPETVFLTFTLLGGSVNIGSLLDNVSIDSSATPAVPEPSGLFLLGAGLMALVGLVRRSRNARA